jgi:iron complex transport system substrate-binding protein
MIFLFNRKVLPLFLLLVIVLFFISSCYHILPIKTNETSSHSLSTINTRVVKHAVGKTMIPVTPKRIITLHDSTILDPVLALNVKPIGAATSPERGILFRGIANEEVTGIQKVGNTFEPSLEKMMMLKPDLIIGREYQKDIYNLLAHIAPSVLSDWGSFPSFQDNFLYLAQVLNKEKQAKIVLNQYQSKIKDFQHRMGKRLQKIEVSVIGFSGQNIKSLNRDAVFNQVIDDAGVKRISIQKKQKERFLNLSIELLNEYDADVLFVINESNTKPSFYLKNPLWSRLKAVKNQQVYEVSKNIWFAGGPLGANKILDDLFKYLLQ